MSLSQKKVSASIRFLHLLLALAIFLNLFVLEEGDLSHEIAGYVAFSAVILRLLLPRFFSLNLAPNLGGKSALIIYASIWLLTIGLGITGFLMGLDYFWGESWLQDIHYYLSQGVQVLVLLHLIGIFSDSFLHKRKTWMLMISGGLTKH